MAILYQDTFAGRTNSPGLGTSSDGITVWSESAPTKSSVAGGFALFSGNVEDVATLGPITSVDEEVSILFTTPAIATGYLYLLLRSQFAGNSSTGYVAWMACTNTANNLFVRINSSALGSPVLGSATIPYAVSTQYAMKFRIMGSSLSVKVWQTSAGEPFAWSLTFPTGADPTTLGHAYFTGGYSGVGTYTTSASNTIAGSTYVLVAIYPLLTQARTRTTARGMQNATTRTTGKTRAALSAPMRLRMATRVARGTLTRALSKIRLPLVTRAWEKGRIRASQTTRSQTQSRTRVPLLAQARTRMLSRCPRLTPGVVQYRVLRTSRELQLIFATFTDVAPVGYTGGTRPNTTIATQLTVIDQAGAPVPGLKQCNVTIIDPAGITAHYTLADNVFDQSKGLYRCTYATTVEGVYTEMWSLVAPDGVEVSSYKNCFRVAY